MNKKIFIFLVVLMSLSLIGIIFVQGYWIKKSVEDKEEQFSNAVNQVLNSVSDKIEKREIKEYSDKYLKLVDSIGVLKSSQLSDILFLNIDGKGNELTIYSHGILEEDYGISSTFFDGSVDSTILKNYTTKQTTKVFREEISLDGKGRNLKEVSRIEKISGISNLQKIQFEEVFGTIAKSVPIHIRITKAEIELKLQSALADNGIDIDFEYGVYSKGLPTKVKTKKFKLTKGIKYQTRLFKDSEGESDFDLLVSFPGKKKYLMASIQGMAILSMIFTLIIVIAYSSAVYQLIKQKQISEIKSDFINNMTHEFKTPIATINLALDAIKNPKIMGDDEKVKRYLKMIREENKRMHAQVENVLRISQLDKNQIDISKDRVDIHDLVDDAINHVSLIISDKGGYINTHLDAERTEVLASDMHFTNVLTNILDNAVKYSKEEPKIDLYTEVVNNSIVIKVKDQGAGMSKAVSKKIFDKFYREHTGNIHNVKGHGLGLAYVKKIVDDHQGEVYVESEKGKGSEFYIKLPLI